jgi:hypothetical protein
MTDPQAINRPAREQRPVNGTKGRAKAGLIRRCFIGRPFMAARFVAKITVFGEYPV